jgi:hypothetical protein
MSETLIFNEGGDPDGATGVHSTVCQSFESDMVPSCFLYRVEALSGGLDIVALLVLGDVDTRLRMTPMFLRLLAATVFRHLLHHQAKHNSNTIVF